MEDTHRTRERVLDAAKQLIALEANECL
jgi:hypothetical protein